MKDFSLVGNKIACSGGSCFGLVQFTGRMQITCDGWKKSLHQRFQVRPLPLRSTDIVVVDKVALALIVSAVRTRKRTDVRVRSYCEYAESARTGLDSEITIVKRLNC